MMGLSKGASIETTGRKSEEESGMKMAAPRFPGRRPCDSDQMTFVRGIDVGVGRSKNPTTEPGCISDALLWSGSGGPRRGAAARQGRSEDPRH